MARTITYREAINEALAQEMERDESVIIMGEDNAGGEGSPGEMDAWGGVLGVTKGLYHKFPGRVLDTPISESAFIGAAIGAATAGMRPPAWEPTRSTNRVNSATPASLRVPWPTSSKGGLVTMLAPED